jgi:hypothetical protein
MSEPVASEATPTLEQESKPVRNVAERVGKFLSENYTLKGAKAKELRAMDRVISQFTPTQQAEMRSYFDKKAESNAKWKVIRNWVATGAGLAVAGWVGLVGPEKALLLIGSVGKTVAGWAGGVAAGIGEGIRQMGAGISSGLASLDATVNDYLFDMKTPPRLLGDAPIQDWPVVKEAQQAFSPVTKAVESANNALGGAGDSARKFLEEQSAGYGRAWNEGIKPFLLQIKDVVASGPNLQRWTLYPRP